MLLACGQILKYQLLGADDSQICLKHDLIIGYSYFNENDHFSRSFDSSTPTNLKLCELKILLLITEKKFDSF